ncbi:hypothetical protein pEaSNUABM11_00032 [Erwinia phage pEa_SNUABM_11]|nr:hypothetical protein pEaSNUABM11_00032 [Erwinia phage pEa_SNUABM_11]
MKEYLVHAPLPNGQTYSAMRQTEEDAFADMLNAITEGREKPAEASVIYLDSGVPMIASRDMELPKFELTIREHGEDIFKRVYENYSVSTWTLHRLMSFRKLHWSETQPLQS